MALCFLVKFSKSNRYIFSKLKMQIQAHIVDIPARTIFWGQVTVAEGRIQAIEALATPPPAEAPYLMPGFVDAHVHIESSMLTPAQFARLAVVHGTVGTVSDPHEIANVLGVAGVEYMLQNAREVPFKFCFGAPSCVPATTFETAGAVITPADVDFLFRQYPQIGYLAEVMNFPGVLNQDPDMMAKIAVARQHEKPIDGHAPGLRGDDARRYAAAGPSTDHECFTAAEASDKLACGMKILIREGSAAKNFEALIGLLPEHFANLMFCSDDKHPDNLVEGHINQLTARAVALGHDIFSVLQVACLNPVAHYHLPIGQLRVGDPADFILVHNLRDFQVLATYLNGQMVAQNGQSLLPSVVAEARNHFDCKKKEVSDFQIKTTTENPNIRVIECLEGQLITQASIQKALLLHGCVVSDPERDLLKIVVVNRYREAPVSVAFIQNFGLKTGALASSVAHDSHNIVAVGVSDEDLCAAVNAVIEAQGGVSAVGAGQHQLVALPIAGLMSGQDGYLVAEQYAAIDAFAKNTLGSTLASPFMSLSFMALLVIPYLKISDLGLFDGGTFSFTELLEDRF
jgi:adenine deaminase